MPTHPLVVNSIQQRKVYPLGLSPGFAELLGEMLLANLLLAAADPDICHPNRATLTGYFAVGLAMLESDEIPSASDNVVDRVPSSISS